MAIYPCDAGHHRYPQAQQSIYFMLAMDDLIVSYKLRLCPSHFRTLATAIQENMSMVDDASQASRSCEQCDELRGGAIYAKVFPAKAEAQHFCVDLCLAHLESLADLLQVRSGSRLRASSDNV